MQQLKTVIHLHTNYSADAKTSIDDLIRAAHAHRIDCVAVTDHNTIRGAQALAARADFRVIIGEELCTTDGHLIGLFLKHEIPMGLTALETARRIHDQGGIVLAPHIFSTFCNQSLRDGAHALVEHIDAVEVFNAQSPWSRDDRKSLAFARQYGLPQYAGSDSHVPSSIAPSYHWMDPFDGPTEFLASLRTASICFAKHSWRYFLEYGYSSYSQILLGRIPHGFGTNAPERVPVGAVRAAKPA